MDIRHAGVALTLGGALAVNSPAQATVLINEVLGSTTSTDTEFVELYNAGAAPVDITGWSIHLYDSDAGSSFGGLDGGSPHTVDGSVVLAPGAHYLFANSLTESFFGVTADTALPSNAIENSSYTIILKDAGGTNINAIFVTDGGAGDAANEAGAAIVPEFTVGPDSSFLPAGFTRTEDGGSTFKLLEFSPRPAPSGTPTGNGSGGAALCTDPVTPIAEVQGSSEVSPLLGTELAVSGVVTADFQGSDPGMNGFFVQSLTPDGDDNTSEGLFVYDPATTLDVLPGQVVRVAGRVSEFNNQTQISSIDSILDCGMAAVPTAVPVALPETTDGELERFEGMLVQVSTADGGMTVAQNFFLGRYGQMTLGSPDDAGVAGRLFQPTNQFRPGTPEALALAEQNARRLLVLDDGFDVSRFGDNPDPVPYLGSPPPAVIRGGDRVENLIGILNEGRINSSSTPLIDYRLQPTQPPVFLGGNPRTASPDDQSPVTGRLRVASFNVLNYFTTIDQAGNTCFGPSSNNCRGADSASELARQRAKIIAAMAAIDADVVGLIELENNFGAGAAIADLVDGLNDATAPGTYAWVYPGVDHIGGDAIAVGFIYKTATVALHGAPAILDSSVDPEFIDTRNRPVVAQTFIEQSSGERFTAAVNHLKSKGSPCDDLGDPDLADGQGNCNVTRTRAAEALARWLASDPTGSADDDFLILGDLNAYAQEDPIAALESEGYMNLATRFEGPEAYSYTFDGLAGSLDHALANAAMGAQVVSAVDWHINTDEPAVISYDENFNPPGYYSDDAYRASDHDPVVIGLDLGANAIDGTRRRDRLRGTEGPDVFTGFGAPDKMSGKGGTDIYVYTRLRDAGDLVTDFEPTEDRIDLRPLLDHLDMDSSVLELGVVRIGKGRRGDATVYIHPFRWWFRHWHRRGEGRWGSRGGVPLVRLRGVKHSELEATTHLLVE